MRARLATVIASLVLAIVSISSHHHAGGLTADGTVCANGSNWDNSIHACH